MGSSLNNSISILQIMHTATRGNVFNTTNNSKSKHKKEYMFKFME